eukprot:TRINITY_DN3795_c1_g1_i3.p1 TRINITY_DN3795_c1_g1~~TRINITY_DN3795_c1_g1_i3.p1  ORF type:complete len:739 (+),score=156.18 TRINITY_DN3795_c1_g1_i3:104-2320(+)
MHGGSPRTSVSAGSANPLARHHHLAADKATGSSASSGGGRHRFGLSSSSTHTHSPQSWSSAGPAAQSPVLAKDRSHQPPECCGAAEPSLPSVTTVTLDDPGSRHTHSSCGGSITGCHSPMSMQLSPTVEHVSRSGSAAGFLPPLVPGERGQRSSRGDQRGLMRLTRQTSGLSRQSVGGDSFTLSIGGFTASSRAGSVATVHTASPQQHRLHCGSRTSSAQSQALLLDGHQPASPLSLPTIQQRSPRPSQNTPMSLTRMASRRRPRGESISSRDSIHELARDTEPDPVPEVVQPGPPPAPVCASKVSSGSTVSRQEPRRHEREEKPHVPTPFSQLCSSAISLPPALSRRQFPRAKNRLQRWFFSRRVNLAKKLTVSLLPVTMFLIVLLVAVCDQNRESAPVLLLVLSVSFLTLAFAAVVHRYFLLAINMQQYQLASELQHRIAVERSAAPFVPAEFLGLLGYKELTQVRLGHSSSTPIAVMFTNVHDFSSLSLDMTSEACFNLVAAIAAQLAPVIRKNGGFVDKYLGDGVMALFERPAAALLASVQIQCGIERLHRTSTSLPRLRVGIGVHYGEVCVGTLGDANRLSTTIVSNVVNLASRFEGLTKYYGSRIIVSEPVIRSAEVSVARRSLGRVRVKGSVESITVFDVFETDPAREKALKVETALTFQQGLRAYTQRELAVALTRWKECSRLAENYNGVESTPQVIDRAVTTKLHFCRRYMDHGLPYSDWAGEDVWGQK